MIEVHHLNNSRSQRVLWMLEELGTPYTIVRYQRDVLENLAYPNHLLPLNQFYSFANQFATLGSGTTRSSWGRLVEPMSATRPRPSSAMPSSRPPPSSPASRSPETRSTSSSAATAPR